jgi:pyrophosphatase PpaX
MLQGMIFDLDGTLADSLSVTFDAFNQGFTAYGGRVHTPQEIMSYFGPGEGEIFARVVGEENAARAIVAFRDHLERNLGNVPLFPGVRELLDRARAENVPLAIVTGRSWDTTEVILRHHGVLDRFVTVICNGHAPSKPSPLGIRLALERMGLEPAQAMYVGDHPMDVRAAKAAGSLSVAAIWDLMAKREHLEPHGPHHWAEHPGEVWEIFAERRRLTP